MSYPRDRYPVDFAKPANGPSISPPAPTVGGSVGMLSNRIYFYKDVSMDSIVELNKSLLTAHMNGLKVGVDSSMPDLNIPIHLHIHSYGGDLLAGISAADTVDRMDVHTHIEGGAASAATLFSVTGKHRTITPHSFILIHQLSTGFWGTHAELGDHSENMERFMESIRDVYVKHTKIPKTKLKEILKHDIWFTAKEALDYGLVDEIA